MTHRILIVGDVMVDEWLLAERGNDAPEPRVPRYRVRERLLRPGGAGNVARQLSRHHCNVTLVSVMDREATHVCSTCCGAVVDGVLDDSISAPRKARLWSDERIVARIDTEWPAGSAVHRPAVLRCALEHLRDADTLILSDYAKGLFDVQSVRCLIDAAVRAGVPVFIDPKGIPLWACQGATLVQANAAYLDRHGLKLDLMRRNHAKLGFPDLVVTRGAQRPSCLFGDSLVEISPLTPRLSPLCVVGAGDCFLAHLALAWLAGLRKADAVARADRAARRYVTLGFGEPLFPHEAEGRKRLHAAYLPQVLRVRHAGQRIIAANGCFDLLHPGHVATLQWARRQGDVLVVLVNDDDGVRELKGAGRPVLTTQQRADMLAGLECVSYVVPFHGTDPRPALHLLKPALVVKGPEWLGRESDVPEASEFPVAAAPEASFSLHSSDLISHFCLR